ncbi:MAG: SRPBCC family protein [Chloroflexi bacterium]|nr:SRPBCC family protein [Chloroflexota bacterium]
MTTVKVGRTIAGSTRTVFDVVANGRNYGEAIPDIDTVEFLTDHEVGVGARFRETRRFNGWQSIFAKVFALSATDSEVTAFEDGKMVRLVTEEAGALWHTTFTVVPADNGDRTRLDMLVEVEPRSLLGKLLTPLLKTAVTKGLKADVEAVKAYVEGRSPLS